MAGPDTGEREQARVADLVAGDWIYEDGADEPVQFLWRSGDRTPEGGLSWALKTTGGMRHFGADDVVVRAVRTDLPAAEQPAATTEQPAAATEQPTATTEQPTASAEPDAGVVDVVEHPDPVADVRTRALEIERSAERSLFRAIVLDAAIAVPVFIVIWVGLITLAVGNKGPDWGVWIAIALVIGTLNGVFFGALAGFITKAHVLDEVDHQVREMTRAARGRSQHAPPGTSSTA